MRRLSLLALLLPLACQAPVHTVAPADGYAELASALSAAIERERADKGIPAMAIAVVDTRASGDPLVWAAGFGFEDPDAARPADADTIWRVGSVSKLFTDMALMQLVEAGELTLDDPVTALLPEFHPGGAGSPSITFRQLTSHRAGLVREPPVGNYFDDTEPSLAATVASLAGTGLVYPPGTHTKYSNAGIAVIGYALERRWAESYARVMRARVLDPLGMKRSAFEPTTAVRKRLAKARMWAYDGSDFAAPTFELGMAPAGCLYASVSDLALFLEALLAGGVGADGRHERVLAAETLATMMTPTPGPDGKPTRFGVGFAIDELEGHRRCGHGGAIYGFSTELALLPDEGLGVVVTSSLDVTNTVTRRLAAHALTALLTRREGRPCPDFDHGAPVPSARAAALAGRYAAGEERAEIVARADGRVWLEANGLRTLLRLHGDDVRVDDRHAFGAVVEPIPDGVRIGRREYVRVPDARPAPAPERWRDLLGDYGWAHNVLTVRESDGALEALIEWFYLDRLEELAPDEFALPEDRGLYPGERVRFLRDGAGTVTGLMLGPVLFRRLGPDLADGEPFTITPLHDAATLRRMAAGAEPPREEGPFHAPDLVELASAVPDVRLDLRYATTNNFMRTVFYPEARALLERPAAEALARAQADLARDGLGLVVFDAYRPWRVTKMFWDATPPALRQFVADPSQGSRHNRGCAVDLGLVERDTGAAVTTVSGYDEFSARSYPDHPGGTSAQRWARERLRAAMECAGFSVYEWEWWHYDLDGWERWPILNEPLDTAGR